MTTEPAEGAGDSRDLDLPKESTAASGALEIERPTYRSRDLDVPSNAPGGGGAFDPITGAIALGLAGLGAV